MNDHVKINFDCSENDAQLVIHIVNRALELVAPHKVKIDSVESTMDIVATHCNGCPLDLFAFLLSNNNDFMHDFSGIYRFIDRKTGKLTNNFLPRCAMQNKNNKT